MIYLFQIIQLAFTIYTLMILVRVVGSWFPNFQASRFMRFIAFYTDPYLNIFRKLIPPIGGVLDLSPLLGYFGLVLLQKIIFKLLILCIS